MINLNMDLFSDGPDDDESPFAMENEVESQEGSDNPFGDENAEEVDPEEIFKEEAKDDVGEEPETKELEDNPEPNEPDEKSSPKTKFYSSAVKALKDDGILPDLDDDFINTVKTPEDFAAAIEKQIEARLDEKQKRINDAISSGANIDEVKQYESVISKLNEISEELIEGDSPDSEDIRKRVIYQDFINRGFKPERAQREVEKSFNSGNDIEDAKAALEGNKEFYKEKYDDLLNEAKERQIKLKKEAKEASEKFSKKVLETEEPFTGIKLDKQTRQKVLENSAIPKHKGKDGELKTEVQKYFESNPEEAQYKLGVLYTMTDGFKNIDKLVSKKVSVEKKSKIRELEHKLRNTPLNGDGSVDFDFGSKDEASFFSGLKLNI